MSESSTLLDVIGKAMRHLGDRQRVIAQNIANSDTPGYKARELAPPSFVGLVERAGEIARPRVVASDAMRRLGVTPQTAANIIDDPDISEVKPDGNDVTLEDQLLKMGQIQADYAALSSLYRKHMTMLRSALGKGGIA